MTSMHGVWFGFPRDGVVGHEKNRYQECFRTVYIIGLIHTFTLCLPKGLCLYHMNLQTSHNILTFDLCLLVKYHHCNNSAYRSTILL